MGNIIILQEMPVWYWFLIVILALWEIIWKVIAMWRAAKNNQHGWYICLIIFNTVGILPIIYLLTHKKNA